MLIFYPLLTIILQIRFSGSNEIQQFLSTFYASRAIILLSQTSGSFRICSPPATSGMRSNQRANRMFSSESNVGSKLQFITARSSPQCQQTEPRVYNLDLSLFH